MAKTYWHFTVNQNKKEEIDKIITNLENLGIKEVNYDEALAVMLEKHKRTVLNKDDVKKIIGRSRGL